MALFAIIRRRTGAWEPDRPIDGQQDFRLHADFMNALAAEGFALLSGPLDGSDEVLLIAQAQTADEIETRLAEDPWGKLGLLATVRISRWNLRIGSLRWGDQISVVRRP